MWGLTIDITCASDSHHSSHSFQAKTNPAFSCRADSFWGEGTLPPTNIHLCDLFGGTLCNLFAMWAGGHPPKISPGRPFGLKKRQQTALAVLLASKNMSPSPARNDNKNLVKTWWPWGAGMFATSLGPHDACFVVAANEPLGEKQIAAKAKPPAE